MTAKEKASEMVNKFYPVIIGEGVATDCAKIAVGEIIEALEMFCYAGTFYDHFETGKMIMESDEPPTKYWYDVKKEIELL